MVSSYIAHVEEFFVTGFISLAIVLATIRAYVARLSVCFEWAGFSAIFIICLALTLGVYLYLWINRCRSRRGRRRRDEEWGSDPRHFFFLPVILDTRPFDEGGRRSSRSRSSGIRLEESNSLGEMLSEQIQEEDLHCFAAKKGPTVN